MLLEIMKGLSVTLAHVIRPRTTVKYPEVKPVMARRFRGRHQLQRHPDGLEKCIGCALCAAACPADAIYVVAAENTPEHRVSPGERYAKIYEINMLRCIFSGSCEEACPTGAIVLKRNYEMASYERGEATVYTKEMLLSSPAE